MSMASLIKTPFLFFYRILFRKHRGFYKNHATTPFRYETFNPPLASQALMIFDVEGALLKSPSMFPYFMLVAFEGGSLLRALLLLLSYPLTCLVSEEMGLKIMVMVCFFGIKKESFRIGINVLPKFFLEEVGLEMFEVLKRSGGGKLVGVSELPQVMVECFLKDYLEIDFVVARELKVFNGYFVGLMEEKKDIIRLEEILEEDNMIAIAGFTKLLDHQLLSHCKEIYLVGEGDNRRWQKLPREKYPKPLIFHDGRLALAPTPMDALALFMWMPFGFVLAIFRILVHTPLLIKMSHPLYAFSGVHLTVSIPKTKSSYSNTKDEDKSRGLLYACNHRTLLDPHFLALIFNKSFIVVSYSLSRISEIGQPNKIVRLTRNRDEDARIIDSCLNQGDMVVCPEGTTCREPYLLRFSPLFAELSEIIVPVAVNSHVTLFYGTTASGLKFLDPFCFFMNPAPTYNFQILENVSASSTCHDGGKSKFDVANQVQSEIGKALGFECTRLTRRDKYMVLAGNNGTV
ncbi:probable glycerol-3-phosphate acyltransferase 2 [Corylus avellana]|uniref:probable glycerol-3-phosphate acyltransferase 2 n=1 Tax=Corylus avellana TaxID=13451 RepID=UPI001E215AF8|nr:probable glycerol-3-phosphate acyltransferase 2 [Corylus avellana]